MLTYKCEEPFPPGSGKWRYVSEVGLYARAYALKDADPYVVLRLDGTDTNTTGGRSRLEEPFYATHAWLAKEGPEALAAVDQELGTHFLQGAAEFLAVEVPDRKS